MGTIKEKVNERRWEEKKSAGWTGGRCEFTSLLTCLLWSDYKLVWDFQSGTMNVTRKPTYLWACVTVWWCCMSRPYTLIQTHKQTPSGCASKQACTHWHAGDYLGMQVCTYQGTPSLMTTCPRLQTLVLVCLYGYCWRRTEGGLTNGSLEQRWALFKIPWFWLTALGSWEETWMLDFLWETQRASMVEWLHRHSVRHVWLQIYISRQVSCCRWQPNCCYVT